MKKYYIYILLALGICPVYGVSEQTDRIACVSSELKKENDSLYIRLEFELNNKLRSNESVEITPWLSHAEQTLILPSLIICGKKQYRLNRRSLELMSRQEKDSYMQHINDIRLESPKTHLESYETTIAFEDWMDQLSLDIAYLPCHCGNKNGKIAGKTKRIGQFMPVEANKTTNAPIGISNDPAEVSLPIQHYDTLEYVFKDSLMFPKAVSLPDFNFGNNAQVWSSIQQLLTQNTREEINITSIQIDAYASPEGIYQFNKELSKNRSVAIEEVLIRYLTNPDNLIYINYHGEDWEGLTELLIKSNPAYKNDVQEIIRNRGIFHGREKELMLLDKGKPYLELQKNLFPKLRRVVIKINYNKTANK